MLNDEQRRGVAHAMTSCVFLALIGLLEGIFGHGIYLLLGSILAFFVILAQHMLLIMGKRSWFWFLISSTGWFVLFFSLWVIFYHGVYRAIAQFTLYHLLILPFLVFFGWRMASGYAEVKK